MALNKPKYNFFKNFYYARSGLVELYNKETSFKIELFIFFILSISLFFFKIYVTYKIALFISLFIPLIAEIINSAIERVVDLVTSEYNVIAKSAKDVGSAIVLMSFILTSLLWLFILLLAYEII